MNLRAAGCLAAILWLLADASGRAQDHDPQSVSIEVLVVRADDGLPMPGVPVQCMPALSVRTARTRDGWLRAGLGDRYLRPRTQGFSDPEGRVRLQVDEQAFVAPFRVLAGAPFVGRCERSDDGVYVLSVARRPQVRVEVVDHRGDALPHFEVGLYTGGRHAAYEARTDANGVATFAIDERFEGPLHARPLSWLGPTAEMPSTRLSRPRQTLRLVVPPFGTLRIRPVDGDGRVSSFESIYVHNPDHVGATAKRGERLHGVEFARVAVGARLRGYLRSSAGRGHFQVVGGPAGKATVVELVVTEGAGARASDLSALPQRWPATRRDRGGHASLAAQVELHLLGVSRAFASRLRVDAVGELGASRRPATVGKQLRDGSCVLSVGTRPKDRVLSLRYAGVELRRFQLRSGRASGPSRLQVAGIAEALRVQRVQVVDEHGAPIQRAFLRPARGEATTGFFTDDGGRAEVAMPRGSGPMMVSAEGYRTSWLERRQLGPCIELCREPGLLVTVAGLPKAWPREQLGLWVRPFDGRQPGRWQNVPLADGDRALLRALAPGAWLVRLSVRERGASGGGLFELHEGAISVTEAGLRRLELALPEATRQQVSARLARQRAQRNGEATTPAGK